MREPTGGCPDAYELGRSDGVEAYRLGHDEHGDLMSAPDRYAQGYRAGFQQAREQGAAKAA